MKGRADRKRRAPLLTGSPTAKQAEFFAARERYVAYGGARGGGKSWALRRKLVLMCLGYPGIRCLLIRRSYPELLHNHTLPLRAELDGYAPYSDSRKRFEFPNGSSLTLGYCACDGDVLRYQGQEFDVIALDEATQLSEYCFHAFRAALRGPERYPKRMYLTCNPGGVGHEWVKRLFIDRDHRRGESPADYRFIAAKAADNPYLDGGYAESLRSLPEGLRRAWLDGSWDLFEGQFLPEFDPARHVRYREVPSGAVRWMGIDYGFDMLAALWLAALPDGGVHVYRECCLPGLTLGEAASELASRCRGEGGLRFAAASPDLWNRRQDSGRSGESFFAEKAEIPPLVRADDRRIPGWRVLRAALHDGRLTVSPDCPELIRCLPSLLRDRRRPEDTSSEPHAVTHAPEALRYALMAQPAPEKEPERADFAPAADGVALADWM